MDIIDYFINIKHRKIKLTHAQLYQFLQSNPGMISGGLVTRKNFLNSSSSQSYSFTLPSEALSTLHVHVYNSTDNITHNSGQFT